MYNLITALIPKAEIMFSCAIAPAERKANIIKKIEHLIS
jgi:hypothetical protein